MKIRIDKIHINARIREDLGNDFDLLKDSIQKDGLIQPITIDQHFNLIAGFRRLECCKELGWDTIEAYQIYVKDEKLNIILELMENIRRKSFTWQEEVKGKRAAFTVLKMSMEDFAKLINQTKEYTYKEFFLFAEAKEDTQIWQAESKTTGYNLAVQNRQTRILKRREKVKQVQEGNKKIHIKGNKKSIPPKPLQKVEIYSDALLMLEQLPAKSMNICIADPPYNIDYHGTMEDRVGVYDKKYVHTNDAWLSLMNNTIKELSRVLKPGAHCYMFTGTKMYYQVYELFKMYSFTCYSIPIIWVKKNYLFGARTSNPGYYPGNAYETILMAFNKGTRQRLVHPEVTNIILEDGFLSTDKTKTHPFEKPKEVIQNLLFRSAVAGDALVDPFCGTGVTVLEGLKYGLHVYGAEMAEKYRQWIFYNLRKLDGINKEVVRKNV